MADFAPAYERTILNEGGYVLHDVKGDKGGQTYAGIARKKNPQWQGWAYIDRGDIPPTQMVREFYLKGWWQPLCLDDVENQRMAETLYDFAINTSAYGRPMVAAKLAQIVVGAAPDGVFGPKPVAALNAYQPELFMARYALVKLARYRDIVRKDREQIKFIMGWINRLLEEAV